MKLRLPTEIVCDGARHHGFLLDVSPSGGFVQTVRTLAAGSEIELRFTDDQLAPQLARARIVRRRAVPSGASAVMRGGIGFEWTQAPPFAVTLGESLAIEVQVDGSEDGSEQTPSACEMASACETEPALVRSSEPDDAAPRASALEPSPAPACESLAAHAAEAGEIAPVGDPPLVEETLDLGPAAVRAEVALIDEGELGEIDALLQSLGASTLRMRWGAQAAPVLWESPPRLVVVSARIALAVPLCDAILGAGALGIAVCDSEANTLRAQLRRQGYELALQRRAHPETLRLLFASLLTRRPERRRHRRRAFGAHASFWRGLRRAQATLLELSPAGASLLLGRELAVGARLRLRVPASYAGGSALALSSEVVRCARAASPEQFLIGLRFRKLSARQRARIDALVRELDATGPVIARESRAPARALERERRSGPRVPAAQQVLVLDPHSQVARDVLFGTELAAGGLRVEPHPRLARGARLQLALQPAGGAPLLLLRAEVARDEGARGLVLRFVSLTTSQRDAIARMLEAAVEVERIREAGETEIAPIVMGRLLEVDAG